MTPEALKRIQQEWSRIAGERVTAEDISGTIYGYCSELGALRLWREYRYSGDKASAAYSTNRNTWYFRLETSL